jgi:hypothetical protein
MMRGGGFGGLWGWGRGGIGIVKKAQDPLFFARMCFTVLCVVLHTYA